MILLFLNWKNHLTWKGKELIMSINFLPIPLSLSLLEDTFIQSLSLIET